MSTGIHAVTSQSSVFLGNVRRHIQENGTIQLTNYFHRKLNSNFVTATIFVALRGLRFINQI
jgi:hypothetical protein